MSIDLSQFIPTFLDESFEGLALMESSLLNIEQGDVDIINAIFRTAHSIKGGAGTFGFVHVTDFTHEVETLLDEMRDGRRDINKDDTNLLLQSIDCIKLLIEAARDGIECDNLNVVNVKKALEKTLKIESITNSNMVENTIEPKGVGQWAINFKPHLDMLKTGNDAINIINALTDLGTVTQTIDHTNIPELSSLNGEDCYLSWQLTLNSNCARSDIDEIFEWVEDECDLVITFVETSNNAINNITEQPTNSDIQTATEINNKSLPNVKATPEIATNNTSMSVFESASIRVGIDKVDTLMNRVGELVITQAMLKQIGSDLLNHDHQLAAKLIDGLAQLESNTRELQEDVMRIRMLPVSFVFNRFPRMVYDISAKLNKKIELKFSGENTEIDKTVMEKIGDPLIHLVRNSLDHGIETPQERITMGKPETGLVHLKAYHQGGYIIIDIIDDGRGLNSAVIKQKALEKGLITNEQELSEQDINELIFTPGFSTSQEINDLSGRGVGMDVVRRNIESLGGHVTVASISGQGSTFSVSLPLTLAILDGQLIKVANETYIVPLISIVESAQINNKQVKAVAGRSSVYLFREEYIPIYSIKRLFSLPQTAEKYEEEMIVIVENNGQKYALLVDELLDQQQFVLKNLDTNYMAVDGIAGATILGNGNVALIIDIRGVIHLNQFIKDDELDVVDYTAEGAA